MAGIYLHIPFCKKACHYCDFHFSTSLKLKDDLLAAMRLEIESRKDFFDKSEIIETVYFGGGSPSILSESELNSLLESIRTGFKIEPDAEITLEANPDDLSMNKLTAMKAAGINRLSIGIQSFRDEDLQLMNRAHNREMAIKSIENARDVGFENLSIDLIYGIPEMTEEQWASNLNILFGYKPEHISAYNLTIEEKTAFGNWASKGKLKLPAEEVVIRQFEVLTAMAKQNNFEHYEISNFALPGKISKHNSSYWKGKKYLGIGPSAHSFTGNVRRWNIKNNPLYIKAIKGGQTYYEEEILSSTDKLNEYILTSLRTSWGLDLGYFEQQFGTEYLQNLMANISPYLKSEQVRREGEKILLSEKGKLVADKITSDLFVI